MKKLDLKNMQETAPIAYKLAVEGNHIYLHGNIAAEDIDGWYIAEPIRVINAARVRDAIAEITGDEIHVHINSYGGEVFEGMAIYNYLAGLDRHVVVHVDGIAASAASIVAMAGDDIHMAPNAMMMIHRASAVAAGNARDLRKVVALLEKIDRSILKTYTGRYTGSVEALQAHLDDELWMTADEAMAYGFADAVDPVKTREPEAVETDAETDEAPATEPTNQAQQHLPDDARQYIRNLATLPL